MTVNISQQQQLHPHEDIHIKRKASESLENEQRLSKRFHRLNIQPNKARNQQTPASSNGRIGPTQVDQYPPQNSDSTQLYQSPSAAINSANATTSTITSPIQYALPQTHNANNYDIQPDINTISPTSSSRNSTSDPEAMQIEDLPRKFISSSPSLTEDDDDGSFSNATNTTDDDDYNDNTNFSKTRTKNKIKNRKDRVILIPTVDKHIDRIPDHLLRQDKKNFKGTLPASPSSSTETKDTKNNCELVLYSDPSSLSVPRERDSVRKVILEARARARLLGTASGAGPELGPGETGGFIIPGNPAYTPRSVPETMATDMQMQMQQQQQRAPESAGTATGASPGGGGEGFDGAMLMSVDDGPSAATFASSSNSPIAPLAAPVLAPVPVAAVSPSNSNKVNAGLGAGSLDGDAMDID